MGGRSRAPALAPLLLLLPRPPLAPPPRVPS
jgi:hypothetical protein